MKFFRIFFTLVFFSYIMLTSAYGMMNWKDVDNWPWTQKTNDGPDKDVGGFYINLGITGARAKLLETNLRVLEVTYIFNNSPAHGKLEVGDHIVGANGKAFQTDVKNGYGMSIFGGDGPPMDFGNALEESQGSNGVLSLNIKRNNQNKTVQLNIGTKYGKYSNTFPNNCPKTELILSELYPFIASQQANDGYWVRHGGQVNFVAAMSLLSSGDPQYLPHVKQAAQFFAGITDSDPSDEMSGLTVWNYNFAGILLSEYYLVTKENWVLQELEEIKTWLLAAQFTDMAQQLVNSHGLADEKQKGGWGHNPGYEGYGPFNFQSAQGLTALSLMKRCGINVPWDRMQLGYRAIEYGTAQNGYVWYAHGMGGGANDWADMGRTGSSGVANYLAPSSDSKYEQMAKLNAKCVGYENRYKSFPDTHGSPHLGMVWTAWAARLDSQGLVNLMDYHRWWFSLTQTHDGNQFVSQPNRDNGGSYGPIPRVYQSAVIALIFSAKNKTLHVTGHGESTGGNTAPVANSQNLQMKTDTDLSITLTGFDADGDTQTYSVQTNPGHGILSGTAPNLTYTPDTGYSGGDSFTFTVSDGTETSGSATISITINNTDTGTGSGSGKITRQVWTGLSGSSITALTDDADYPDNPDTTDELTLFEAPKDWADDYGTRIIGYIHPPVTGTYTFWIASDDNGQLWLSTDDSPNNKRKIANVPEWTAPREWTKFAEQQSSGITLTGGQRYYIEALHKEGGGGDHVAVAWQRPGGSQEVIPGSYLSPFTGSTDGTDDETDDTTDIGANCFIVSMFAD